MATINSINSSSPIGVVSGGSGVATMTTAYAPVCAGTTATGALQVASTGLSTSGYVLTSTGASSLPTFQAAAGGSGVTIVATQYFTATGAGTYTPTASMKYCVVECVGGGGGGGSGGASGVAYGGGGGGGGYSRSVFSAATIGASKALVVGALGAGGTAGGNNGSTGSDTTFGTGPLMTASGGVGGSFATTGNQGVAGAGGAASSGDFNMPGGAGFVGTLSNVGSALKFSGPGGYSFYGFGGANVQSSNAGLSGTGYGSGGSGGSGSSGIAGGGGANGIIIVTEYI